MQETLDPYPFLQSMAKRPAMYVGRMSLRALGHYIEGYFEALRQMGGSEELTGFVVWVEQRYLISHCAWHWTRILLHVFGGDEAAIQALPELFLEYQRTSNGKSVDELRADRDRALIEAYGKNWYEPEHTSTSVL